MRTFIYNDNPTRRTFVSQRSNFAIGTVPTVSTKNDMSLFFGKYLLFPTTILSSGSQLGFTCRQRYTVWGCHIYRHAYIAFSWTVTYLSRRQKFVSLLL